MSDDYIYDWEDVSPYDGDAYLVNHSNDNENEYWHWEDSEPFTDDNGYDYDDDNYED